MPDQPSDKLSVQWLLSHGPASGGKYLGGAAAVDCGREEPSPGRGPVRPSPSADLHIGNLRTAVLAWLFARSTGRRFLLRVEDLDDRTHDDIARRQLADLAAIGESPGRGTRNGSPDTATATTPWSMI